MGGLGWQEETTGTRDPVPLSAGTSGRRYFYHRLRREVSWDLPYYELLGLPPGAYKELTKEDVSRAYFARRMCYTKAPTMELKDEETKRDWEMIVEAFKTLIDPASRTAYEQRNLAPTARKQLVSVLQIHRHAGDPAVI